MSIVEFRRLCLKLIICFFVLLISAILLLTLVYSLPVDRINANMSSSAEVIKSEGEYPHILPWCTSQLDNFTDSIMLLIASEPLHGNALESAMASTYSRVGSEDPYMSLTEHYLYGSEFSKTYNYHRYWHGYLLFLKPLLTVTDYAGIRIINTVFIVLMVAFLLLLLLVKKKYECILPVCIMILLANPLVISRSLQFSTCFHITLVGLILLILLEKRDHASGTAVFIFLFLGMSTAFMDFLTYPLATYCVPAAMYMYLNHDKSTGCTLVNIVKTGLAWLFGFAGMWGSKWIVGSIVLRENLFTAAMKSAKFRTSGDGVASIPKTIIYNLKDFFNTPFSYIFLIFVFAVFAASFFVLLVRRDSLFKFVLRYILPYTAVIVLPFIWYVALHNHSAIHHFFTNKALMGTAFGLLIMATDLAKNYIGIRFKKLHS